MTVKDIEHDDKLIFVDTDYDVQEINNLLNTDYDSYFVEVGEGEYKRIYGMYGIIPYINKTIYEEALK